MLFPLSDEYSSNICFQGPLLPTDLQCYSWYTVNFPYELDWFWAFCSTAVFVYSWIHATLSWLLLLHNVLIFDRQNSSRIVFKNVLTIWGLLYFHKTPENLFFSAPQKKTYNRKGNLKHLWKNHIFSKSDLPIHEHCIAIHLFRSFINFFSNVS